MIDKSINTTLKDWLLSLTAKELGEDEKICNKVISWSYLNAKEATKNDNIHSIELSGFGKMLLSPPKIKKRISMHEKGIIALENLIEGCEREETKILSRITIENKKRKIEWLKNRINDETMGD